MKARRNRAASQFSSADFLKREACGLIADRLEDMSRNFPLALDLGSHRGELAKAIPTNKVEKLIHADLSEQFAKSASPAIVADDEWLPFAENSLDAIFSAFSLHWVNDLPGALIQARMALKPDGLFLAVMPGAKTFQELRAAFADAETAISGGISARFSPFVEVRDAGNLLQRAGFNLIVTDSSELTLTYPDLFSLLKDLRAMGETNALTERPRRFLRRDILAHAAALYRERHTNSEGRLNATIELITLTGWKPDASQPKPLKPGSGQTALEEALKLL